MTTRVFWRLLAAVLLWPALAKADDLPPGLYFAQDRGLASVVKESVTTGRRNTGIQAMVTASARAHGVPVGLAHGVIKIESGYRCSARNGRALGIGQIFRATARSVGVTGNLMDCSTGLEASMRYLRLSIDMHGAGCAGASGYNTGVFVRSRCTAYGRRVMQIAGRV